MNFYDDFLYYKKIPLLTCITGWHDTWIARQKIYSVYSVKWYEIEIEIEIGTKLAKHETKTEIAIFPLYF